MLTANPRRATKNIILPSISSGFLMRSMASIIRYIVSIHTKAIDAKAPMDWALWKPNEY